jgi:hypothetical protein
MSRLRARYAPYLVLTMVLLTSAAVVITWAVVGGVQFGSDSARYLEGGRRLLAGEPLPPKAANYIGYVVLVGVFDRVGLGAAGVIALQIVTAAMASLFLFDLGRRLAGPWAGVAAAALFGGHLDLVRWHTYLLTDSLYISGVVIFAWAAHRAVEAGGYWYGLGVALALVAAAIRPNGWVLIPMVAVYWLLRCVRPRGTAFAISVAVVIGFVVLVTFAPGLRAGVDQESPGRLLAQGVVIWGAPDTWVAMPVGAGESEGIGAVLRYAAVHPLATAGVAIRRVGWELLHGRPYYSVAHNFLIAAVLGPTYVLAVWGIRRAGAHPLGAWLVSLFAAHLGIVALTFADYDGRFLLYGLPMLMVLAGVGTTSLLNRWAGNPAGTRASQRR